VKGGALREQCEAQIRLEAWHEAARWVGYVSAEFVADQTTASYLQHVGACIRDEGERRHSEAAGFRPAVAG